MKRIYLNIFRNRPAYDNCEGEEKNNIEEKRTDV